MKQYSYLVVDCSALCYSNSFVLKGLRTDEIETGVIFGFLSNILTLSERFKTNKFVLCWDSKESNRKLIFPEYKKKRKDKKKTPEEKNFYLSLFRQMDRLRREIIPYIGFGNSFQSEGFEGDDIIADIVLSYENCLIVSGDEDLYQLLDLADMLKMKTDTIWTEEKFINNYKINPMQWADVKAIGGCSSDEIPGAPGVAETNAIKWLKKELKSTTKAFQSIVASKDIIDRNYKLVKLPLEGTPEFIISVDNFNINNFREVCKEYWIDSFLTNTGMTRWNNFFTRKSICPVT